MTPRFIIKNINETVLESLLNMGYINPQDEKLSEDILVLGTNLIRAPLPEKNPLLKVFDLKSMTYSDDRFAMEDEILKIARIQKLWTANINKSQLVLGEPPLGLITVTALGVMIDSCIITIDLFEDLYKQLIDFKGPLIASHRPVINPKCPFTTIGCADYSLNDLQTIISTYKELKDGKEKQV